MRKPLRIFVATGTGPAFTRLLSAVAGLSEEPGVDLFVQRGQAGERFADLPGADFISRDAFGERLAWADVVICHGGAGAVYEACLAGHVPIVLPRLSRFGEIVNDHQLELVNKLAASGKAILCADPARLRDLALSASPRAEPVRITPALVDAVRREIVSPVHAAGPRGGFLAAVRSLYRRVTS